MLPAGLCPSSLLVGRQEVAVVNRRAVVLCLMSEAAAGSGDLCLHTLICMIVERKAGNILYFSHCQPIS